MDAIELFLQPLRERKKLEKEFFETTYSRAYLDLCSLNNICECYLQRRKVKQVPLLGLKDGVVYQPLYYKESSEEQDKIPDKQLLMEQYIATMKSVGSIPPQLEELYQKAVAYKGRSGRSKESVKERATKSGFVGALMALAFLEKSFTLGIFPLRTREEARLEFYRQISGGKAPEGGGRDTFNIHLKEIRKELNWVEEILTHWYHNGVFSNEKFIERYQGRLPKYEAAAFWFFEIIQHRIWTHW